MADVLVSTLLDKLASTTYQYVADEVKLVLNVKKEVEEFAGNLQAIESVLEDAERRQMKEANVQNWLDNLKEISHEMVDVLDEWHTDILRQEVEKQDREGADHLAPQRKEEPLDPAIKGTINVLTAAKQGGVSRVVLRSSISAITPSRSWVSDKVKGEHCWTDIDYRQQKGVSYYNA